MRSTSTTLTPGATRGRSTSWSPSASCAPFRATRSPRAAIGWWSGRPIRRKAASTTSTATRKATAWTARLMSAGEDQKGFTYLALLIAVAVGGGVLAAVGELTSHAQQREKEAELLFSGHQYRQAIAGYYERAPGGA